MERSSKYGECFEGLYYFFIMPDVQKRRAVLAVCCLYYLYGCYAEFP